MIIDKTNYKEYMSEDNILDCNRSNITEIRYLPEGLIRLYCHNNNQLISLPELPEGLRYLYCYGNELTSLPDLPKSLIYLDCEDNKLTSLPDLPESLDYLDCNNNEGLCYCAFYYGKKQIKAFIKKLRLRESLITFLL